MATCTTQPTEPQLRSNQHFWPIMRVLGWEFVRCLRISGLLFLFCLLLLPWVLFRAILDVPQHNFQSANYYPGFYWITSFLGIILTYEAQKGVRAFLSTRPLTTKFMFAWLLGIPVATVITTFIAANTIVQVVYGVDWPWLRPILWLVFFVTLVKCMYWRIMIGRGWEIFGAFGLGALAVFCFAMVQGGQNIELHRPLSIAEVALLSIATWATLSVGYRSLSTIRTSCGDVGSEVWLAERFGKVDLALIRLASRRATRSDAQKPLVPLKTSRAALEWMAWRQVGMAALAGAVIIGCGSILVQVVGTVDYAKFPPHFIKPGKLFEITVVMFLMSCFGTGTGVGLVMAAMIRSPGHLRQVSMSAFHGVRPISNKEFHRVLGRAMFRYCVLAWLVLIALVSILPLIAFFTMEPVPKGVMIFWGTFISGFQANLFYSTLGSFSLAAWMLFGFLVMWSFAGVTSSVVFFGNDRGVAVILCAIGGLLFTICIMGLAFPDHLSLIATASWTAAGLIALAATLWVFQRAWFADLILGRQMIGAVCLWTLLAVFAVHFVPPEHLIGVVMLSSLVTFGVAGGPLGLTASRHR